MTDPLDAADQKLTEALALITSAQEDVRAAKDNPQPGPEPEPEPEPTPDNPNTVTIGTAKHKLDGTDVPREANQLIRYTDKQAVTPTNVYGVEVIVNTATGIVAAVNNRVANNGPATPIAKGNYVLSGHDPAGQWLLTNAKVGSTVVLSAEDQPTPPTPTPTPPGGKIISEWYHSWKGPFYRDWPGDVKARINTLIAAIGQSGGSGTGKISFSPSNGQSQADYAVDVRQIVSNGGRYLLGIGGSSDGGIHVMNEQNAQEAHDSITALVNRYGFNGLDIDLEPSGSNWTQDGLLRLCSKLKATHGASFTIGATVGLYGVWTDRWCQFMVAAGNNVSYLAPMLYDFPESTDSRIIGITVDKCNQMVQRGVPSSKIVLGYMLQPNPGYPATPTVTLMNQAIAAAKAKYPDILGVFHWEHAVDSLKSWQFARGIVF